MATTKQKSGDRSCCKATTIIRKSQKETIEKLQIKNEDLRRKLDQIKKQKILWLQEKNDFLRQNEQLLQEKKDLLKALKEIKCQKKEAERFLRAKRTPTAREDPTPTASGDCQICEH